MKVCGCQDPCAGLIQPALDAGISFFEGEGSFVQAGVRSDPDKRGEDRPAECDRLGPTQLPVPPNATRFVVRRQAVLRVEKNVGVDESHAWSSPSATARSSEMLS